MFVVHFSRPGSFPAPRWGGAPVAGVVLRSYEQSKGTWVAHIANVSRKNVVFVNITVNENGEVGSYYAAAGSERYYYSSSGKLTLGSNAFSPNTTKDLNLGADAN